ALDDDDAQLIRLLCVARGLRLRSRIRTLRLRIGLLQRLGERGITRHAEQGDTQGARQLRSCDMDLHRIPLPWILMTSVACALPLGAPARIFCLATAVDAAIVSVRFGKNGSATILSSHAA